jgi:hypothetical protein
MMATGGRTSSQHKLRTVPGQLHPATLPPLTTQPNFPYVGALVWVKDDQFSKRRGQNLFGKDARTNHSIL